jgi:hypothetical protein
MPLVRREKVALLALQKGWLVGRAKPNVPLVRWQKFIFLCGGVFYFVLGRLECRQVGLLMCVVIQRNCLPS